MKRPVKPTRKRAKRELFAELTEGMDALADARLVSKDSLAFNYG